MIMHDDVAGVHQWVTVFRCAPVPTCDATESKLTADLHITYVLSGKRKVSASLHLCMIMYHLFQ